MNNAMTHKGLSARIDFDVDDNIFFGRLLGTPATHRACIDAKTLLIQ